VSVLATAAVYAAVMKMKTKSRWMSSWYLRMQDRVRRSDGGLP
jgi:hypothetical protein